MGELVRTQGEVYLISGRRHKVRLEEVPVEGRAPVWPAWQSSGAGSDDDRAALQGYYRGGRLGDSAADRRDPTRPLRWPDSTTTAPNT